MITLNDMKSCQLDESMITYAYSREKFIMEVIMKDESIKSFKYLDENVMVNDIFNINNTINNDILLG